MLYTYRYICMYRNTRQHDLCVARSDNTGPSRVAV